MVFGWISGRLLGVRRGFWRALVAGLIGLSAGYALVYLQFGDLENLDDLGDIARLGIGFVGYVLLVTMIASIVIEAILRPTGQVPLSPAPSTPLQVDRIQVRVGAAVVADRHGGTPQRLVGRKYASRAARPVPKGPGHCA